jgi:hypothetical protein
VDRFNRLVWAITIERTDLARVASAMWTYFGSRENVLDALAAQHEDGSGVKSVIAAKHEHGNAETWGWQLNTALPLSSIERLIFPGAWIRFWIARMQLWKRAVRAIFAFNFKGALPWPKQPH